MSNETTKLEDYQRRRDIGEAEKAQAIVNLGLAGHRLNDAIRNGRPEQASESLLEVFRMVDQLRGYP